MSQGVPIPLILRSVFSWTFAFELEHMEDDEKGEYDFVRL